MQQFQLDGHEYIELYQLLKICGLCPSGGAAKMAISDGQVRVDQLTETRKRRKLYPGQVVDFANQQIRVE